HMRVAAFLCPFPAQECGTKERGRTPWVARTPTMDFLSAPRSPCRMHGANMNHSPATSRDPAPLPRLDAFVQEFGKLLQTGGLEADILQQGSALLARLVQQDDWLPASHAQAHPE